MKKISLSVIMLLTWCAAFATPPTNAIVTIYDGLPPVEINPYVAYSAKLGPTWAELNPGATDTRPTVYLSPAHAGDSAAYGFRVNPWQAGASTGQAPDNDYWTDVGQVASMPDDVAGAGIDRIQTFAYYSHVFATSPRIEGSPEPFSQNFWINGAPVDLKHPACAARNVAMTSNEAFIVYSNGFIAPGGTQTSRGGNVPFDWPLPGLQLPTDEIPSAIALTTSNEFALVSTHNKTTGKGRVAIIALEGHCIQFHTWQWIGFPNQGSWSDFKLMGFIDLPFANPDSVSAATNGFWWGTSSTNNQTLGQIDITTPNLRASLNNPATDGNEAGWTGVTAVGGYAIVSSKTEGKVSIINLTPLVSWFRHQYLDADKQAATLAKFNWVQMQIDSSSRLVPRATADFPGALTAANTPTVVTTLAYDKPTCVLAGQLLDRWSDDRHKAYVATESGVIHIIDTTSLLNRWDWEQSGPLAEIGSVIVGANPVCMCFARFTQWGTPLVPVGQDGRYLGDPTNQIIHVACRGSRSIDSVVTKGGTGIVYQSIKDTHLQDPVCVSVGDRGNIVTVCDYNGKQLVSYRIGPLWDHLTNGAWGAVGARWDCGPVGTVLNYECAGVQPIAGHPFWAGSNNLN